MTARAKRFLGNNPLGRAKYSQIRDDCVARNRWALFCRDAAGWNVCLTECCPLQWTALGSGRFVFALGELRMLLSWLYLVAAVLGGTILICQFLLALFGLGHDSGLSHHAGDFHSGDAPDLSDSIFGHAIGDSHAGPAQHPDSTHLFAVVSLKTLVAAAAFFGVTGFSTLRAGFPPTTTLVLAVVAGTCAMYGMYWLLGLIVRLDSEGNERIANALGQPATVYVPIPATGRGTGKVQLSMQNRIVEYQAVTDGKEPLKTGESVVVVGIKNDDTVEVRRATSDMKQAASVC
jgi:hypothetical protein